MKLHENKLIFRVRRIANLLSEFDAPLLHYAFWVRWKRIDFAAESCERIGLSPERSSYHAHSGGPYLDRVIQAVGVPQGSHIIDFGSGKGLAAITLSRYFAAVTGVEMSQRLCVIAKQNIRKLKLTNIRIECADAGGFKDGLDQISHVYMFHPFPAVVMKEVMGNLRQSVQMRPRRLTIIYKNPFCDDVLLEAGFKRQCEFKFRHSHPFAIYSNESKSSHA